MYEAHLMSENIDDVLDVVLDLLRARNVRSDDGRCRIELDYIRMQADQYWKHQTLMLEAWIDLRTFDDWNMRIMSILAQARSGDCMNIHILMGNQ